MRRRTLVALAVLPALFCAAALAARALPPADVTIVPWAMQGEGFGGWSGIEVSDDGTRFWAICDSGTITRGTLQRDHGEIIGVTAEFPRWIKGESRFRNTFMAGDAEGIALGDDGRIAVSYERFTRVWQYAGWQAPAEPIGRAPAFQEMAFNSGLEALAVDTNGDLLTLAEVPPGGSQSYPLFRHDGEGWAQPYALARNGFWRAVGADIGPDGMLYLLERQFLGVGFASQIRRFDLSEAGPVKQGVVLYRSPLGRHGNLEGIGIWRDPAGQMRAVMVSDDNYQPFMRTEIVEVVLG